MECLPLWVVSHSMVSVCVPVAPRLNLIRYGIESSSRQWELVVPAFPFTHP